ncbi:MAG: hypothetical protein Q9162_000289 [Coniocarpon cinnabarinum]
MNASKVLVPEKLSAEGLSLLQTTLEVDERKGLAADEVQAIIPQYEALIVRSETKVTAELLKAGTRLKVVARAGVGTDNIVGITVARMAIGLGMRVIALDPYASPAIAQAANVSLVNSMDELLPSCDWLTIHTPLMASTKDLIGEAEIAKLKPKSRLLNVARGGVINEAALLAALESGHVAGAGIDVFTTEPPEPGSAAANLIAHPRVVATPHLGASTVEAQENVSIDVCEQVVGILAGDLPRSAVNAPLILPEEFKTLQPFVRLVEKMGSLYTQYFSRSSGGATELAETATTFELLYEGALATLTNTKPLFAALVKGLIASVSSTNVTIVNAEIVARERGIVVNEQKSRDASSQTYSSLVTLRARSAPSRAPSPFDARGAGRSASASGKKAGRADRVISGYVSGDQANISRLGRFATSFNPEGHLVIAHNYDTPGMIGKVGGLLGTESVNISAMSVAPVSLTEAEKENGKYLSVPSGAASTPAVNGSADGKNGNESLMILSVDQDVSGAVVKRLNEEIGILRVNTVAL